MIYIYYHFS